MNPIDLVYLHSIGSLLEQLAADKAAAAAEGASDRARELDQRIEELSERRHRVAKRLFGYTAIAAD